MLRRRRPGRAGGRRRRRPQRASAASREITEPLEPRQRVVRRTGSMSVRLANERRVAVALAILATIALAAALILGWSLGDGSASANGAERAGSGAVKIKSFKFKPGTLTVSAGTTVKFTNRDSAKHTATDKGVFNTHRIKHGKSKSITFNSAGTFRYICTIHPF